jgi:phage FluMu protein gp41
MAFDVEEGAGLLDRFALLRASNVAALRGLRLTERELALTGEHPELGPVTLAQLLATWVVHDLDHLAQAARVLAKRHAEDVGPWRAYLSVLQRSHG